MSPVFEKFSKLWQFSYVKESQNLINSEFSNLDIWLNFLIGPKKIFQQYMVSQDSLVDFQVRALSDPPQDFVAISDVRAERVKHSRVQFTVSSSSSLLAIASLSLAYALLNLAQPKLSLSLLCFFTCNFQVHISLDLLFFSLV